MNRINHWHAMHRGVVDPKALRAQLIEAGLLVPTDRHADSLTPLRPSTRRVLRMDDRGRAVAAYLARFKRNAIDPTDVYPRDLRKLQGAK